MLYDVKIRWLFDNKIEEECEEEYVIMSSSDFTDHDEDDDIFYYIDGELELEDLKEYGAANFIVLDYERRPPEDRRHLHSLERGYNEVVLQT